MVSTTQLRIIVGLLMNKRPSSKNYRYSVSLLLCIFSGFSYAASLTNTSVGAQIFQDASIYNQGMYAILTGTGGGTFSTAHGGASVAVVVDGEVIQFDIGMSAMKNLTGMGIYPDRIDHLLFTHLHIDHTLSLPHFLSYLETKKKPVKIVGPPGTNSIIEAAKKFFDVQSIDLMARNKNYVLKMDMEVREISTGGVILDTGKFKVIAALTPHHAHESLKSFAYRVESRYGSVVISGDTAPSMNVVNLAKDADLLIHEAMHDQNMAGLNFFSSLNYDTLEDEPRSGPSRTGHTSVTELGKVARLSGVKKLVVYHHSLLGVESVVREKVGAHMKNGRLLFEPEMKYEAAYAIKKNYSGPVVIGEPKMVFQIDAEGDYKSASRNN